MAKKMSFMDILTELDKANDNDLPKINIYVLRNITLEPIFDSYLKFHMLSLGFSANITYGTYDNIYQDIYSQSNEFMDYDYILIFSNINVLMPKLFENNIALDETSFNYEKNYMQQYITTIMNKIRERTKSQVIWSSFEIPIVPSNGIADFNNTYSQTSLIQEMNLFLKKVLNNTINSYYLEINQCIARVGAEAFYNDKLWHISKTPYNKEGLNEISFEISKYIRSSVGKSKKCIVLDCDNVLWGGIIGEDGLAGIQLGQETNGASYVEFQNELVNLHNRGIILALCSKNNKQDVLEVFKNHPDMALKIDHIALHRINWENKASNILDISKTLNIGLDSIVFIDDSELEIELVNNIIPEVTTILFPKTKPFKFKNIIQSCGLFDTLIITEEDKKRNKFYKENLKRSEKMTTINNLEDYLKSINMEVDIFLIDDVSISRVAQLIQRSNQFNLTTRRYTEDDVRVLCTSDNYDILCLKLKDRYGDLGLVAISILNYCDTKAVIDTFLISCRALGREVEDVLLKTSIKFAKKKGFKNVEGIYKRTDKNNQVNDFYPKHGFEVIISNDEYSVSNCNTDNFNCSIPNIFKRIDTSGLNIV